MARLLESRVFIAGCSVLGGHVAVLLARLGIGALRLCDPDVFEESHLNRQCFCTEQTLSRPKVLACRDDLSGMASHMEIGAREVAADPENLPELLFCCDAVVNCLDSIPKKKMFEEAACAKAFPLVPGAVLGNEGFAFGAKPGVMRLCLSRKNTWADIREQTTLGSLFSLGSYAIRRSAEEPGEGRLQDVGRSPAFMAKVGLGCRQRRGLSCPFPARESEDVSKSLPFAIFV